MNATRGSVLGCALVAFECSVGCSAPASTTEPQPSSDTSTSASISGAAQSSSASSAPFTRTEIFPGEGGTAIKPPLMDHVMSSAEAASHDLVTIGSSGGTAGLPGSDTTIAATRTDLQSCYKKGLVAEPTMRGSVRFVVKVGPQGTVTSVKPTGRGLSDDVVNCMSTRLKSLAFKPPDGGDAVLVVPVTAQPE